jgi:hypothetical protein
MLHDPGHIVSPKIASEIVFSQKDKDILRRLVQTKAEIAALPIQKKSLIMSLLMKN